jgi:SAM-dependent methyltransferase
MLLKKVFFVLKSQGYNGLLATVRQRIFSQKALCFQTCEKFVLNKTGLEIGGPSGVFKRMGILPIYPIVEQLDNCNFSKLTTWEGQIIEGRTFQFDKNSPPGQQYLTEAADLSAIESDKYDFILSSHMLEHSANPLEALSEWLRVLKVEGIIIILVPHKDATFDHQRPVTTLAHLIEDFECQTKEDDLTHLPEILELHDLSKDPGAGTLQSFKERSAKNVENRCLHHHVFDTKLAIQLLDYKKIQILAVEAILPQHIIVVAQKILDKELLKNEIFTSQDATWKHFSPFNSDKL